MQTQQRKFKYCLRRTSKIKVPYSGVQEDEVGEEVEKDKQGKSKKKQKLHSGP